jgi:hypothetical protein
LSKWFQTRRFVWEFPIGSYDKLSSAVAAILVEVCNADTILEGDHPRIISANLVEIGSVVSEEKIFF